MKCPKCGFDNNPNNKFCSKCGEQLKKESLYICPRCGNDVSEDDSFCPSCGLELKWVDVDYNQIPIPKTKKANKKKEKTISKDKPITKAFFYTGLGLMLLAALLLLIGLFGDITKSFVSGGGTQASTTRQFTYLFKETYDSMQQYKDTLVFSYGYLTFLFVLLNILFVLSGILIIGSAALIVIKMIKKDFMKDNLFIKIVSIPLITFALYLLLIVYLFFTSVNSSSYAVKGETRFGTGTGMIVAGIIIYFVGLFALASKGLTKEKPQAFSIASISLSFISVIFVFVAMINMHCHTFGNNSYGSVTYIAFPNIMLNSEALDYHSRHAYITVKSGFTEASVYSIVALVGLFASIASFYLLICNKKILSLTIYVSTYIINLVAFILLLTQKKAFGINNICSSFIIFNVFFWLSIACVVLSMVFNKMSGKRVD